MSVVESFCFYIKFHYGIIWSDLKALKGTAEGSTVNKMKNIDKLELKTSFVR